MATGDEDSSAGAISAPFIRQLTIQRFRGIKDLVWHPSRDLNIILGGGDVGKTTILDAIGLLLSPTNQQNLPDTDYFAREVREGFQVEAIVSLPESSGVGDLLRPAWPWHWDGAKAVVPSIDDEPAQTERNTAVYRLRVRANDELELSYEIVQPDGTADSLTVALRRAIGLVRLSGLSGEDRNDRDLRLVQGSALDRLLSDKSLRSRLASELAKSDVKKQLGNDATTALTQLNKVFAAENLPSQLDLSIIGSQGVSIAALIGLTAEREGVNLPLSNWGAGTRRLCALTVAEQQEAGAPITLIDEVERGLEPYRQRSLVEKLKSAKSQVFVTTHSPFALSAAHSAAVWYMDHTGRIGSLVKEKIAQHQKDDPETFLSRFPIVAEGKTELGFVSALLERGFSKPLAQYGIYVSDGGGHERTLGLLEALSFGGLRFGAFADDEGKHPERWAKLQTSLGGLLFRWQTGCLEENIVGSVPEDKLEALIVDPEGEKTGYRLRTMADRLSMSERDFTSIATRAGANLRGLMIAAATGLVAEDLDTAKKKMYRSHGKDWFKTVEGGRELEVKLFTLGPWPIFSERLLKFLNEIRGALGLVKLDDLS